MSTSRAGVRWLQIFRPGNEPNDGDLSIDPEDEARLLPYMPSLLSLDLPPCGPIPQVAYEKVLHRLRKAWLHRARDATANDPTIHPASLSLLSICTLVKDAVPYQGHTWPAEPRRGTKADKRPRREQILKYEYAWAKYFKREADTMEKRPGMSRQDREKLEFNERLLPVPKELKIVIPRGPARYELHQMWIEWQTKKRGPLELEDDDDDESDWVDVGSENDEQALLEAKDEQA